MKKIVTAEMFETELAARCRMLELWDRGIGYTFYHESCCRFWVTVSEWK